MNLHLIHYNQKTSLLFPRHDGVATISESFALNLIITVPLTNKVFALLKCKLKQNFLLFSVKLIEYIFPAVNRIFV